MNTTIEDLKTLIRDAEEVLANAGDTAEDQITTLRQRMRDALDNQESRLRDLQAMARERMHQGDEFVRTHPYQTIGAAALVGALVGIMLRRCSH